MELFCKKSTNVNIRLGFTLAEVLITLGIIGIVAALTMPNLIASHKKQVWVAQLRKTVSTLEQGFQKMRADAGGVDSLEDTEPFVQLSTDSVDCSNSNLEQASQLCQNFFKNDLKKYFNIIDYAIAPNDYKFTNLSNTGTNNMRGATMLVLNDNAMMSMMIGNGVGNSLGVIEMDVNGFKAPNKYGYDVFLFDLRNDGILVDSGNPEDCKEGQLEGQGCYNYLAQNGWKMDY